jgi:hypothetical protein
MHHTNSDLVAILSVALGKIPPVELADLTDHSYDRRKTCQRALAARLEAELLKHFDIARRGMPPLSNLDQRLAEAGGVPHRKR